MWTDMSYLYSHLLCKILACNIFFPHIVMCITAFELTVSELMAGIPASGFCVWYILKKHWLANNILGIAFSIQVLSFSFALFLLRPSLYFSCIMNLFA